MNSVILKIASKYVRLFLFSAAIFALLRGHNLPGGGFIGGLLAGLAVVYKGFAYTFREARQSMRLKPEFLIASGLSIVLLSMIPGILNGKNLMHGIWYKIPLGEAMEIKIGTPFIFDIGVFLTVIGVTVIFLLVLNRE